MKRSFHCLLLIFLFTVAARAQSVEGDWEGTLKGGAREIPLVLHVTKDEQGGLKAPIDSPTQVRLAIPVTTISLSDSTLKFEIRRLGSYEGKVNAEGTAISGIWTQGGSPSPLDFKRARAHAAALEPTFLKRTVTVGKNTYGYRVYLPEDFDARESYPVVLYLHGTGQKGDDNEKQTFAGQGLEIRRTPEQFNSFIAVLPQIPENSFWVGERAEQAVKALDQTIVEFNADPQRLYLTGRSVGGYGAWYIAANYPGKFAAVVPLAGGIFPPGTQKVPPDLRPLVPPDRLKLYHAKDPYMAFAKRIGKTPVWIFHGSKDETVPVGDSRKMAEALRAAKGSVRFTEYRNEGHELPGVYAGVELWKWLLTQRLSQ